jgi:hypothetical protein
VGEGWIDAVAVVLDSQNGLVALLLGGHLHAAAGRGELHGIVDQVPNDLLEPDGVAVDDQVVRGGDLDFDAFRLGVDRRGAVSPPGQSNVDAAVRQGVEYGKNDRNQR